MQRFFIYSFKEIRMKNLFLAFALVSGSALACPDLAGTYKTCHTDYGRNSPGLVTVLQYNNGEKVTYSISTTLEESGHTTEQTVIADGEPRNFGAQFEIKASCADETLTYSVSALGTAGATQIFKQDISREGHALIMKTTMWNFNDNSEFKETVICE
jgi:hypothetical protein